MPSTPPTWFRILLRLYPRAFRERYAREMEALFRREREAAGGGAGFWLRLTLDHVEAAWGVRARRREDGRMTTMSGFTDDLRASARSLARAPAFALFAVATLALGVGATSGVFTVVERVLLRPLPYPGSERMALVGIDPRHDPGSLGPLSPALFTALQERPGPAEAVVAARQRPAILRGGSAPERVRLTEVSDGFFPFFGVRTAAGRLLQPDDHEAGAPPVVVLGHGVWRERYGGDPDVVGRSLELGGTLRTVVGVVGAGFHAPPEVVEEDDYWVPLEVDPGLRSAFFLAGVLRLRPNQSTEAMELHADETVQEVYAETGRPDFLLGASLAGYREAVVGPVSGALGRVMAGVALLLLIACVNVASLLLTRGAERKEELAVHAALGAPRARLVRRLLTESALLALLGGLLGSGLAWGAVELFQAYAPAGLPRLGEVALDWKGLAFALTAAVSTVLLFGLLPALRSTRGLAEGWSGARGATADRGEKRLRAVLVAAETALAVVMVVGSALLAHDLIRVAAEDAGFRSEGLLTLTLDLEPRYAREEWHGIWERLMEQIAAVPGAVSVGVATQAPYDGSRIASTYRPGNPEEEPELVISVAVGGDYLEALGTRLLEGRALGPGDEGGEPVAMVNESFVRRYWPGEEAVGRRLRSGEDDEAVYRVVGVVADVRTQPGQEVPPQVFHTLAESPWRQMELLVRTDGEAGALAPALRRAVARVDPALPVTRIRTMEALASRALAQPRFYAWLFGGFASVALLLALVGVYGTTAYAVRVRTRETGIRLALGARRGQVVARLVGRAGGTVALGVALGLAGAALASRALAGTLRYVEPRDLPTYAAVGLAVAAVGVLAAWIPAGAAGRADPAETLRRE